MGCTPISDPAFLGLQAHPVVGLVGGRDTDVADGLTLCFRFYFAQLHPPCVTAGTHRDAPAME